MSTAAHILCSEASAILITSKGAVLKGCNGQGTKITAVTIDAALLSACCAGDKLSRLTKCSRPWSRKDGGKAKGKGETRREQHHKMKSTEDGCGNEEKADGTSEIEMANASHYISES